jgi:molecular chaperone IbpA
MTRTKLTTFGFPSFAKSSVGFDDLFKLLTMSEHTNESFYPPYNIIRLGDTSFAIEVAVAGFNPDEIEVTLDNNTLAITGSKSDEAKNRDYVHQGISNRSFQRMLPLAEHIQVQSASVTNGILTIMLEKIVPEALKPRRIPIVSNNLLTDTKTVTVE